MQVKQIGEKEFEDMILNETAPVLVDFFADWCGPCKMLAPVLEELADDIGEQAVIIKVNVDENQELAMRYHVMSVPSILIFKNGKQINSSVGFHSKEQLKELLQLEG